MKWNWKVIGLLAVAVGLAVVAYPPLLGLAPILLLAICPLSMLFMGGHAMHSMRGGRHQESNASCHDTATEPATPHRLSERERRLQSVDAEKAALSQEVAELRRSTVEESKLPVREAQD